MRVADLASEVVQQICACRYDRILEKHEGRQSLTIFFKDTTFAEAYGVDPEDDTLYTGFLAGNSLL